MESVAYYIIYPGGRQKIRPTPKDDQAALRAFENHWTAKADYTCENRRRLIKEEKSVLVERESL